MCVKGVKNAYTAAGFILCLCSRVPGYGLLKKKKKHFFYTRVHMRFRHFPESLSECPKYRVDVTTNEFMNSIDRLFKDGGGGQDSQQSSFY